MTRKAAWLLACALAAGLIAAGCGGDDDDNGGGEEISAGGAPTKAEFIAQGEEICAEGAAEIRQEAAELRSGGQPTPAQVREFITDTFAPSVRTRIKQLRDLQPPEGDEDRVDAILAAFEDAVDQLASDPSALTEGASAFSEANRMAREYGFSACAPGT